MPTSEVENYKIDYHPVGGTLTTELLINVPQIEDGPDSIFALCLEVGPVFRDAVTNDIVSFPYPVSTGGTCTSDVDCSFNPPPTGFSLTLQVSPVGAGTAVNFTANNGGPTPPYDGGEELLLIAEPAEGFQFVRWTKDSVEISINAALFYTMPEENVVLVAEFEAEVLDPEEPTGDEETEVATPVVPANYLPNLYENCSQFILVQDLPYNLPVGSVLNETLFDGLNWTTIREPEGWDTVRFKMERTDDYGFTQEASLDSLIFNCLSGKDFLDEVFIQDGGDANVKFIFAVQPFGTTDYIIQIINDINFTSYVRDQKQTKVNLEGSEFNQLLLSREDVPYIYPRAVPVFLYSKALPQYTQYTRKNTRLFEDFNTKPDNLLDIVAGYGLFNSDTTLREVDGTFTYPDQLTFVAPNLENKYVMKPKLAGRYEIDVKVAATALDLIQYFIDSVTNPFPDPNLPSNGECALQLYVQVRDAVTDEVKFEEVSDPTSYQGGLSTTYFDGDGVEQTLNFIRAQIFDKSYQFELNTNDELYVYLRYNKRTGSSATQAWSDGNAFLKVVDAYSTVNLGIGFPPPSEVRIFPTEEPVLSIYGLTLQKATVARQARLFDAMNSVLKKTTEKARDVLVSDFLGTGGALHALTIGNGFSVRNKAVIGEGTDSRSSFKDLYMGAKALVNLGYNVEVNEDGKEVVRVEEMDYFFADKEIITFTEDSNLLSFEEGLDPEYVFNELEFGYNKFSKDRETDKGQTLDDSHGKLTFLTPIRKNKNKLSVISNFVGSAFEIERVRRKQFEPESENSNEKFDSDVYMVNLRLDNQAVTTVTALQDLNSDPNVVEFVIDGFGFRFLNRVNIPIIVGDEVEILYNNVSQGSRLVKEVVVSPQSIGSTAYDTYVIFTQVPEPLPVALSVDLAIILPETRFIPESTEPFVTINNLESPQTHYNLRYTPKRMMKNWGKFFNAGLSFKDGAEDIKFQLGEGNTELETELSIDDPFPLGDIQRDLTKEGADITLSQVWGRNTRFLAYYVTFSLKLGFDIYNYIMRAHKGNSADDNNYGYIQIPDFKGNLIRGYLVNLEYDPNERKADFRLLFSQRLPILEADIIRPVSSDTGKAFVDQNGNYIQHI